jgi:hypothetical protein
MMAAAHAFSEAQSAQETLEVLEGDVSVCLCAQNSGWQLSTLSHMSKQPLSGLKEWAYRRVTSTERIDPSFRSTEQEKLKASTP